MEEPKDRLKLARAHAGFESPSEASRAHKEINKNTLISHENGNRLISKKAADTYARLFKVSKGWLLTGEGFGPDGETSSVDAMIRATTPEKRQQILDFIDFVLGRGENT